MVMFLLVVFCLVMYGWAVTDWISIKQPLTWKDVLFIVFAPVTVPFKLAVVLWILFFNMPFCGRK